MEDHALLVRKEALLEFELFDPNACYRREFFDMAWNVRMQSSACRLLMPPHSILITAVVVAVYLCDA